MSEICERMEAFGKGIGNATRYRIVQALCRGPRTVSELVAVAKISQPAVSQHLKTLRSSGIVQDRRCGQEVVYELNTEHILDILKNITKEVVKPKSKK